MEFINLQKQHTCLFSVATTVYRYHTNKPNQKKLWVAN